MKGYMGKFLRVDLGRGRLEVQPLDEELARNCIGGSGLAARLIYDETGLETDPLGPNNLLVFATGPLVGTRVSTSGRHAVCAKSPLTGIWAESDVGGTWGTALKRAGYDAIAITGCSPEPVYLWVHDGKAELRSAEHVWGTNTYELDERLKGQTDKRATVACIGRAGERLVRYAAVMHDGRHARAAGRCGLGAVMGAKRLKAIVVHGTGRVEVDDPEGLRKSVREILPEMVEGTRSMKKYGTSGSTKYIEEIGDLPIRNWRQARWPKGAKKISGKTMAKTIKIGNYFCASCVIGCGKEVEITEGPYTGVKGAAAEYETVGTLGSLCLVDDLEAISMANQLCNQYGLDTISTGGCIAFAMEACERGLIESDLDLTWGNAEAVVELVRRIGEREGLGELLGEGVCRAAAKLGGRAGEFAIHVKGLELPAHDPRAFNSLAVGYATSNRGACHMQAYTHPLEAWITFPDLGYPELLDPHANEGKGAMVAIMQNLMCLFDALKVCKFSLYGGVRSPLLVEWLNMVTGWELDHQEFLHIGERLFNLKRMYNVHCGISRKDDWLPLRILAYPRDAGGAKGNLPHLGLMLNEYYRHRGWDEEGIPTAEKLRELGLE